MLLHESRLIRATPQVRLSIIDEISTLLVPLKRLVALYRLRSLQQRYLVFYKMFTGSPRRADKHKILPKGSKWHTRSRRVDHHCLSSQTGEEDPRVCSYVRNGKKGQSSSSSVFFRPLYARTGEEDLSSWPSVSFLLSSPVRGRKLNQT